MDQWQGMLVAAICVVITAFLGRWARRAYDRRKARQRTAAMPAASRQVRRAQARRRD